MPAAACPDVKSYQQLMAGQLPPADADTLIGHLETCDQCANQVAAFAEHDTLVDLLRQAGAKKETPGEELARLLKRLRKQTPLTQAAEEARTLPPQVSASPMISFTCASCGKGLKARQELAGKKVRCPGCKNAAPVPGVALAAPVVATHDGTYAEDSEDEGLLTEFLAPAQAPDEIGRLGGYRVLKIMGAGGMGVVYKAEDPNLKRIVALKAMLPRLGAGESARKRFIREAQTAASINHDNIVHIYQVGEDRGIPFMAMQFLEGEPLDERLKREPRLPVAEILRIGRETAEGLAAAHKRGLIHRDVKPANLWLETRDEPRPSGSGASQTLPHGRGSSCRVKILDFGLARAMGDTTHLTQSGAIVGTPAYMAPEQAGGKPVDHRCDLFSLGCVLYRLCTGEMPFKGADTISILSSLALDDPAPPVSLNFELPTELSDLVMQMLSKDPAQRPESAQAVADALLEIESQSFSGEPKATRKPPKSKSQTSKLKQKLKTQNSKLKTAIVVSATAVAALIIAGIVLYWQTPRGMVKIETDDPAIEIVFDKTGPTIKGAGKEPIALRAGEHGIVIKRGDFQFGTDKLVIKKGETITLKIQLLPGKMQLVQDGKVLAAKSLEGGEPGASATGVLPKTFTNSLGMEFVLVPKGKSWLGWTGGIPKSMEVDVLEDFYLGRYEVTQEEWEKVTGGNPSRFSAVDGISKEDQKRFPVEQVSWDACQLFIEQLNKQAKETGWVYRMPTQLEWEYACRGGPMKNKLESMFEYYFDKPTNTLRPDQANFYHDKGLKRTCKVGSYHPNRLGLYDMHGNVWEWCLDEVKDEKGQLRRVLRGGSWPWYSLGVYAAHHDSAPASHPHEAVGLRVARVPVGKEPIVARPPEETKPETPASPLGRFALLCEEPHKPIEIPSLKLSRSGPLTLEAFVTPTASVAKIPSSLLGFPNHGLFHSGDRWMFRWNMKKGFKEIEQRPFAKDQRAHVAGVLDAKEIRLYVDGRFYARTDIGELASGSAQEGLQIGGGQFPSILDEIRVSKIARYQADFTPAQRLEPDGNTLALYHCDEGQGNVLKDSSGNGHHGKIVGARWVKIGEPGALATGVLPPTFQNSLGMEFVLVPKGKSWLGGGGGKPGDKEVEFKEDFYLGKYEVTQEEWEKVMGNNPSLYSRAGQFKDKVKDISDAELKRFPVDMVSYDDAQRFLESLNQQNKQTGWVYRLPTADEWEYACRGGPALDKIETSFDYYLTKPSNTLGPDEAHPTMRGGNCKVGSYKPNRVGLHDMHGNVAEWTDDLSKVGDPKSPRLIVGGRAALRSPMRPGLREGHLGLRLARVRIAPASTDPDRKAADYVLSIGGSVGINENGQEREIKALGELPRGAFELRAVELLNNARVDDVGMRHFEGCKNVTYFRLAGTRVSDAGLEYFKDCKNLKTAIMPASVTDKGLAFFKDCKELVDVHLGAAQITDAGLANIKNSMKLVNLVLYATRVTDAGLAHFRDCKFLQSLHLHDTAVTDAGLVHFKDCKTLYWLTLDRTKVTDKGLANFKNWTGLTILGLAGTSVGDEGLAHFKGCKKLHSIWLDGSQVTDAALGQVAGYPDMTELYVNKTKITAASVKKLAAALPRCTIVWDGGVIRPAHFANSLGMEFVLVPKGKSWLGGGGGKPGDKEVEIKDDFYLGKYEVTQAEWQGVTGNNPSHFSRNGGGKDAVKDLPDEQLNRFPVENITWSDVQLFLTLLNKRENETGWVYRLPTEAEWEYACRGGPMADKAGSAFDIYLEKPSRELLPGQANFAHDKGLNRTCKVGSYRPNHLGLYDMHGNVWEWCHDEVPDPKNPKVAAHWGVRGGSLISGSNVCVAANGSAQAFAYPASVRHFSIGLRVARVRIGPASSDPDRKAAEYVLSIGGSVGINENGKEREIKDAAELPTGAFQLIRVGLYENKKVNDAGLAIFKDCKDHLTDLHLAQTQVSDAGLVQFKDCKRVRDLNLGGTQVSDAGLAYFKHCKQLWRLELHNTKVTDAGLLHFRDCTQIGSLHFGETQIGDRGLAVFKDCKGLGVLELYGSQVSDAGLTHFKDCNLHSLNVAYCARVTDTGLAHFKGSKSLYRLALDGTKVTDAALANFKDCKDLGILSLSGTAIGDPGLANFKDCKKLAQFILNSTNVTDAGLAPFAACLDLAVVDVRKTKVTAAGVKKLAAALPKCKIEWNGGVIEAKVAADPDRKAAEYVLSIGGTFVIWHRGGEQRPKAEAELPRDTFQITNVQLPGIAKVTDAGLANFKGCTSLKALNLSGTQVTDSGLAVFKDCKGLAGLELHHTSIGAAGLAHFKDCKELKILGVSGSQLTDAALAQFQDSKNFEILDASGTALGDAGLAYLKGCTNLIGLTLTGTKITDAGLSHLKDCKSLTNLTVDNTSVGDAGLAHFKDCKNLGVLNLGATKVSDAGLVNFKNCKDLHYINLADTHVSDVGLVNLKDCQKLRDIHLNGTQITDKGLAHFKDCKNLWALTVFNTQVSDAGLKHLKECKELVILRLNATRVSDAGLAHLVGCPKLGELSVKNTKVSAAGVKKLAAALPKCKIEWDGGVIEAKTPPVANAPGSPNIVPEPRRPKPGANQRE